MNGAEFIVRMLIKNNIRTVFGYPGGTGGGSRGAAGNRRSGANHGGGYCPVERDNLL